MTKTIYYVTNVLMKKRFDKNYDGSPIFWLSTRINENKPMCYYLNPPGGHIESGASRRQTLIQETLEEASILQHKNDYTFEFTQRFTEQKETRDKGIRIIFVYSSYTDQEPITPSEEQENLSQWELYTLQDIFTYKTVDSFREYIIRKLQEIPVCINHISAKGEGRILHPSIGQVNHHYLRELCKKYKKELSILEKIILCYEMKIHRFSTRQLLNIKRKNDNNCRKD